MALSLLAASAIAYGIGAAMGAIGYGINATNSYDYYADQYSRLKEAKKTALSELKLDYEEAERQGLKNAARQDARSTLNEILAANDVNSSIGLLAMQQEAQNFQQNQAAQSAGAQKGNSLSQMAASGIRSGGSMAEAVKMEAAQNSAMLQMQQDTARKQNDFQLANVLTGLTSNVYGIQEDRTDAYDLRESFRHGNGDDLGGYQWQKYQNAIKNTTSNYDNLLNEAASTRDKYDPNQGEFWLGLAQSALTMGNTAMGTYSNFAQMAGNAKANPNYSTAAKGNSSMALGLFNNFKQPTFNDISGMYTASGMRKIGF